MKVAMISFAHMHAYSYAEHVRNQPGVELAAVWDEDAARGKEAADRFGAQFYGKLDELLQSDAAAVIVCSENAKHHEHVIAAAQAGKHVLCEKPIAVTVDDARRMIEACEDNGVILQIAFPVRYSPAVRQAREMIRSGALGRIVSVNATNHGKMPGGWFIDPGLSGGGAATDHIVHVMDIMYWILEDRVKHVYAELDRRLYDIEVEDCGIVLLETESGTIASIDPSWSRPATFPAWGDVFMEFVGTKGTLQLDVFKQSSVFYNDIDRRIEQLPWMDDLDEALIADFIDIVKQNKQASISGLDGLRTLEVVKAAYESSNRQRFVPIH